LNKRSFQGFAERKTENLEIPRLSAVFKEYQAFHPPQQERDFE
jgi:hypothetical protein